jgi:hypothetical protein
MTNYLNLPLNLKKDNWQIFGAKAYINGLFLLFHLKDTIGSKTASELRILDFFKGYTSFYQKNSGIFKNNDVDPIEIKLSARNISASLLM